MTKAEQFLWCVQTALLNNQLMLSRSFETAPSAEFVGIRHVQRVSARAIWAVSEIPESLSASDAAEAFCDFAFDNLWREGQKAPEWLVGTPK